MAIALWTERYHGLPAYNVLILIIWCY